MVASNEFPSTALWSFEMNDDDQSAIVSEKEPIQRHTPKMVEHHGQGGDGLGPDATLLEGHGDNNCRGHWSMDSVHSNILVIYDVVLLINRFHFRGLGKYHEVRPINVLSIQVSLGLRVNPHQRRPRAVSSFHGPAHRVVA